MKNLNQKEILQRIEDLENQTKGLTLLLSDPESYHKKRKELNALNKALKKTMK